MPMSTSNLHVNTLTKHNTKSNTQTQINAIDNLPIHFRPQMPLRVIACSRLSTIDYLHPFMYVYRHRVCQGSTVNFLTALLVQIVAFSRPRTLLIECIYNLGGYNKLQGEGCTVCFVLLKQICWFVVARCCCTIFVCSSKKIYILCCCSNYYYYYYYL